MLPINEKMDCVVESTLKPYATALMSVWNDSNKSSVTTPIRITPSGRKNLKITCLMCCNLMFQSVEMEEEDDEKLADRKKYLTNMCTLMNLSSEKIPQTCLKGMFPFCKGCKELLKSLLTDKETVENLQRKMAETIKTIQKNVVQGETRKPKIKGKNHPVVAAAEARKFKKLREMILEGYTRSLPTSSELQDNNGDASKTVSASSVTPAVAKTTAALCTKKFEAGATTSAPANDHGGSGISVSENDGDCFAVLDEKQKLWFKGVEYFRCIDLNNKEVLQCSLCSYTTIFFKSYAVADNTAYMEMKNHIKTVHKQQSMETSKLGLQFAPHWECSTCDQKFSNRKSFRKHKAMHRAQDVLKCDVCGRVLKSDGHQGHLLMHKLTHLNEQERKAALAADEKGTYNAVMRNSEIETWWRRRNNCQLGSLVKTKVNSAKNNGGCQQPDNYQCRLCKRTFAKANNLANHMRAHTVKKKKSTEQPFKTVADVEVLKVKRLKKKVFNTKPPILTPKTIQVNTQTTPKAARKVDISKDKGDQVGLMVEQDQDESAALPILKRKVY